MRKETDSSQSHVSLLHVCPLGGEQRERASSHTSKGPSAAAAAKTGALVYSRQYSGAGDRNQNYALLWYHRRGGSSLAPTPFERLRPASSTEALLRRSTIHIGSSEEVLVTSETNGALQAAKAARNQSLWREVNERIRLVASDAGDMEFLCECADLGCTETLHLSLAEYEHIRSSPTRFPIALGHELPEFENVIEETNGYAVVQKKGTAAEVAAQLDHRS